MKDDIENSHSKEARKEIRKERNTTMKLIRQRIKVIEENEINSKLEEIEKHKDHTRRCFIAMKELNRKRRNLSQSLQMMVQLLDQKKSKSNKLQLTS